MDLHDVGSVTVAFLDGPDLQDEMATRASAEKLYGLVHAGERHLELDLGRIDGLIGSAVLAMFVTLHRKLMVCGGTLVIRNLKPHIRELFEITCLNRILDIRGEKDS